MSLLVIMSLLNGLTLAALLFITASGLAARLLLQVHDELVLEAAPDALEQVLNLTRETMERAVELSVPLRVETGVGPNWMEAK